MHADAGEHEAVVSIKAGSLDNAAGLEPIAQIWTSSKMAGTVIPAGVLACDGQPQSDDGLIAAFTQKFATGES